MIEGFSEEEVFLEALVSESVEYEIDALRQNNFLRGHTFMASTVPQADHWMTSAPICAQTPGITVHEFSKRSLSSGS